MGPDDPAIALIGEAPGRDENRIGDPFVGKAGHYLNWGLHQAGINRERIWITNVLPCQPPSNIIDSPEAREALECCGPGFWEEISWLEGRGLKVLGLLGVTALRKFSTFGITEARGSVLGWTGTTPLIATFHPSYLNRMSSSRKKMGEEVHPSYKYIWIADLKKIRDISVVGWIPPVERFNIHPVVEDVERFMSSLTQESLLGVDIETTGFNPKRNGHIVVVGLATSGEDAISIPFLKQGGNSYWSPPDEVHVSKLLRDGLQSHQLMFQNGIGVDLKYLNHYGFTVPFENIRHDIILIHHCVSPELPHNLPFIVSVYGRTPYWKEDFKKKMGSILSEPDELVRVYNLRDAVVLHQVLPGLLSDLHEIGAESVYEHESLKLIRPVYHMMENGVRIDQKALDVYTHKLQRNQDSYSSQLHTLGSLPPAFNPTSGDDLRYFLFGIMPSKMRGVDEAITSKKRTDTLVYKNLLSLKELRDQTHPIYIPTSFRGRTTRGGKLSTDEKGLLSLQVALQNRLSEIEKLKTPKVEESEKIKKLLSWLEIFYKYRELDKLISTYSDFPRDPDGRTRSSFSIHGTVTGRFSSSGPNLQNQPKEDLEIRKAFTPENGNLILGADYQNLEVWVLAYETGESVLLDALKSGVNIHDMNTELLFNVKRGDAGFATAKRAAKTFFFGGISYGGGERKIYEDVILECPQLALTFARFKQIRDSYISRLSYYKSWRTRIEEQIKTTRKVSTFTGRVRILMGEERDIVREGVNFPIQGDAASIVNRAMIRIDSEMFRLRLKSKLILQVHDEFVFEVVPRELLTLKTMVKREMERPVDFHGQTVSFPVSLKVGKSWGDLK